MWRCGGRLGLWDVRAYGRHEYVHWNESGDGHHHDVQSGSFCLSPKP